MLAGAGVVGADRADAVDVAGWRADVGTFGTALAGLAAALVHAAQRAGVVRRHTPGSSLALTFVALGVDRPRFRLRHALTEDRARRRPGPRRSSSGPANGLRVSPDGRHFLAVASSVTGAAAAGNVRRRPAVADGSAGRRRDVAGVDGDFVDDERMLLVDVLDRGVELRLESVDGGGRHVDGHDRRASSCPIRAS